MGKKAASSSQKGKEVLDTIDLTGDDGDGDAPLAPSGGGAAAGGGSAGAGGAGSSKEQKKRKHRDEPSSQSQSDGVRITGVTQAPAAQQQQHQHQHHHGPQRLDEELGTQQPDEEGEELARLVCYGAFSTAIVGIQYYNGIVSRKEQVRLVREPTNRYDRNAIRVDNIRDEQVGHIPRDAAVYLSPMLDKKILHHVEGGEGTRGNARHHHSAVHVPSHIL